jgi:uncharacterized protein
MERKLTMTKLEKVKEYAIKKLNTELAAHDFSHSLRVMKIAQHIANKSEMAVDTEVILVAGLTHDIIDKKVAINVDAAISELSINLSNFGYSKAQIEHVLDIIQNMSYSSGKTPTTLEGKIVQDADRLEAVGAVAVARTFAYGGKLNRVLYNENDNKCSIAHFYEKLLLLKDMMNTKEGKNLAISRHNFMEEYLSQFYKEINLEDLT